MIILKAIYLFHSELSLEITSPSHYLIELIIFPKLVCLLNSYSEVTHSQVFSECRKQTEIHFSLAKYAPVYLEHNCLSSTIPYSKITHVAIPLSFPLSHQDRLTSESQVSIILAASFGFPRRRS